MIKQMNGWKAISDNRTSVGWISRIYYPVNKIVYPTIKYSYLFFFILKEDAEKFYMPFTFIVPCIAYNCKRIESVCFIGQEDEEFWTLKKNKKSTKNISMKAPKGTWIAESIKCLR